MIEFHQAPSAESLDILASLRSAVHKCLVTKQRLNQYAIVWEDGRAHPLEMGPSDLQKLLSQRTFLLRQLGGE